MVLSDLLTTMKSYRYRSTLKSTGIILISVNFLADNKFGCTNGEITTDFVLSGANNIKGNAAVAVKSLQLGYTTLENLKLNASGDNSYLNFSVISPNSVLDMNPPEK